MIFSHYGVLCSLPFLVAYSTSCTIRKGKRRTALDLLVIAWGVLYAVVQIPVASWIGSSVEGYGYGSEGWAGVPLSIVLTSAITAGLLAAATRSQAVGVATLAASIPAALLLVSPSNVTLIAAPAVWHLIVDSALILNARREQSPEPGVCPACGYSLAGLPRDRPCPECGSTPGQRRE